MDFRKIFAESWHSLLAHWITYGIIAVGGILVSYWGILADKWSWPGAVVMATLFIAAALVIWEKLTGAKQRSIQSSPKVMLTPKGAAIPATWSEQPKQVIGQRYENETIPIDGKLFLACTFKNVVFEFEGLASFGFDADCKCGEDDKGHAVFLRSSNPIVQHTVSLCRVLHMFRDGTEYRVFDPKQR